MKRADRLEPVQKIMDDTERRLAEHYAAAERLLKSSEKKLQELSGYRDDYTAGFARRAGGGMGARELVDYQAFMARLGEAIKHQSTVAQRARADCDVQRKRWQEAAQRAKALGHVMETWQREELRAADRRDQRESDERGQRRRVAPHGH
jgi:flagellar protein FliJ